MSLPDLPLGHLQSKRSDHVEGGLYGDLEPFFQGFRASLPLDLNMDRWRRNHPDGSFAEWRTKAKAQVLESLHYHPGPLDLGAEILEVEQREGFRVERVAFNTSPWSRVEGCFLCPDGDGPFPAVVALHAWGGSFLFGKEQIVSRGKSHPRLDELINTSYGGRYIGDDLARRGYAVLVIDAFHFGRRAPWGAKLLNGREGLWLPPYSDPLDLDVETYDKLYTQVSEALLYGGFGYLGWAGTTLSGVHFWDDSRCVDYLISRPEVDGSRIACVGLSGGGRRVNLLAALDDRIGASASVCWMTTGDWGHLYGFTGAIGSASTMGGLWQRMDYSDLGVITAPRHALVIAAQDDRLFSPEGMEEAAAKIRDGFEWAGVPDHFLFHYPQMPHSFPLESQNFAWDWFDRSLNL